MLGNMEAAEEEFIQSMAHAGEFEPLNALGLYYLYARQGEGHKAIKVLEEATSTHLGFLQGLGYLGRAHARTAHNHEAVQVFTTYGARVPRNPWVKVRRAHALARIGKHDLAIKETREVLRRFPRSLMVRDALAARLLDAEKFAEARKVLREGLKEAPKHAHFLARMSQLEIEKGSAEKGLALADEAVALIGDGRGEPLAGYAHLQRAHALAVLDRNKEALTALGRAKELGIDGDELVYLKRDIRARSLLQHPRNPFK